MSLFFFACKKVLCTGSPVPWKLASPPKLHFMHSSVVAVQEHPDPLYGFATVMDHGLWTHILGLMLGVLLSVYGAP